MGTPVGSPAQSLRSNCTSSIPDEDGARGWAQGAGWKLRASDILSLQTAGARLGFQALICFIGGL